MPDRDLLGTPSILAVPGTVEHHRAEERHPFRQLRAAVDHKSARQTTIFLLQTVIGCVLPKEISLFSSYPVGQLQDRILAFELFLSSAIYDLASSTDAATSRT